MNAYPDYLDYNSEVKLLEMIEKSFALPHFSLVSGCYEGTLSGVTVRPVRTYDKNGGLLGIKLQCTVEKIPRKVEEGIGNVV